MPGASDPGVAVIKTVLAEATEAVRKAAEPAAAVTVSVEAEERLPNVA
jgi:hypothetical protein